MFVFSKAFFLALLTSSSTNFLVSGSFGRDVVAGGTKRDLGAKLDDILSSPILDQKLKDPSSDLHQELLTKALPIREFELKYGVNLQSESHDPFTRRLEENDDFAMNGYNMISFSGYSLKFAKCQPVQYFSERALQMGEHSPMITNDIVVLRLCPTSSCSSTATYGCQYNFSEYAMELAEYVRIMLYYSATKRDYMCDYCNQCLGNNGNNRVRRKGRRLEDGGQGDNGNENQGNGEDEGNGQQQDNQGDQAEGNDNGGQEEEANGYNENQQANDDGYNNNDNNDDGNADDDYDYSAYACNTWNTYCSDYTTYCLEDNQNGDDVMAFEDYLDYLYCSEINYNNYAYFVKPRCDGYQGTIKMGIFYDKYCNQYAGNEVSLKNLGMGFRESAFQDFYSSSCLDCSESDYPPYDASSTLCNRMHYSSAKCTEDMAYDLFAQDGQEDDATECSFIESIRFGTYNELGQLTTRDASGAVAQEITETQKTILGITVGLCVALVVYACYLHHAMTNLLIKSLSHRELLPPSRHQSRQRVSSSPRRSGRRLKKVNNDEPDWDDDDGGEYA